MAWLLKGCLSACSVLFLNLTSVIGQGVAYVRINELLARGTNEAEPPREWVELFNGSTQGQDLSGYRLRQGDDEFVIETLQMDAGGFAVIQPSIRLRGRGGVWYC